MDWEKVLVNGVHMSRSSSVVTRPSLPNMDGLSQRVKHAASSFRLQTSR